LTLLTTALKGGRITMMINSLCLRTIGHSNHTIERFVSLLKASGIQCVLDIRSYPRSKWNPQFKRESLAASLLESGIEYRWLGYGMGGLRPATEEEWSKATEALLRYSKRWESLALMCSEGSPVKCHRLGLSRRLITEDIVGDVEHIMPDGETVPHIILDSEDVTTGPSPKAVEKSNGQGSLFG
jgi:uncharacterized protein (DUF488 family)